MDVAACCHMWTFHTQPDVKCCHNPPYGSWVMGRKVAFELSRMKRQQFFRQMFPWLVFYSSAAHDQLLWRAIWPFKRLSVETGRFCAMTFMLHPTDGARHTGLRARDHFTGFFRLVKLRSGLSARCLQQAESFWPEQDHNRLNLKLI